MTRSRRAVLAATGGALAAIAGCSTIELGGEAPDYDPAALAALGETTVPTPPAVFPVAVPDEMLARHRNRARRLIDNVPTEPEIPNEVVAKRLRDDRQGVLDRLEGRDHRPDDLAERPLEGLDRARHVRAAAAAVEAAYRAATDDITAVAVAERRDRLRRDSLEFDGDWTYQGDALPATAVIHRRLEDLRADIDRSITPEQAVPSDPRDDVFAVGNIVRSLETGRAALTDAADLRQLYRKGLVDPQSYRSAIAITGAHLRELARGREPEFRHNHNPDADELPFDRDITDTPLERLYREAASAAEHQRDDAERASRRGAPATAMLQAGQTLVALRTLEAVVKSIRETALEPPETVDEIADARTTAVQRLESAWAATPPVLAVELARPAQFRLHRGIRDLRGHFDRDHEPTGNDADRAFVNFVYAAHAADAVPPTVADIQETIRALPE